jgi:tRNA A-37 threonylcarbamoyl transferase component Bud32
MAADVWQKDLTRVPSRDRFVVVYSRLAEVGLAPAVLDVTDTTLSIRRHEPMLDWIDTAPPTSSMREMGGRLLDLLERVHAVGVCHRDTHVRNFVIDGGMPLIIDPKYAVESNPQQLCYDVHGPEASGVPVPDVHLNQGNENRFGVWWDAPYPHEDVLGRRFGPSDAYR